MASRRSSGRRSVMPGRSSVHRCPSRLTLRAAFFLTAFLTATEPPSYPDCHLTVPATCPLRNRVHRRIRAAELNVLLHPNKEPIPRSDDYGGLNVQVPARDFRAQLADLLTNCLSHRLADALRLQNRGVRTLADLDTGGKDRSQIAHRREAVPSDYSPGPGTRRARAIVPFKSAKSEAGAIREDDPSPDGLQGVLSVAYVGVVNPNQCTPGRY
jgi:hypothetical protein